jgi:hypothetical protein
MGTSRGDDAAAITPAMKADELSAFWDSHNERWLAGDDALSDALERWCASLLD